MKVDLTNVLISSRAMVEPILQTAQAEFGRIAVPSCKCQAIRAKQALEQIEKLKPADQMLWLQSKEILEEFIHLQAAATIVMREKAKPFYL